MNLEQAFLQLQIEFEKLVASKEQDIKKNYAKAYEKLRKKLQKVYDDYEKDGQVDLDELKKYNRIKKLDIETAAIMLNMYIDNKKLIRATLNEIIKTTEKSSFNLLKGEVQINPIRRNFVSKDVINQEIAGKIWTKRMEHYGDNFVYDVHSIVRGGLEQGDTYTTMAKKLKDKFGKDLKRATTIARTESARVQEYTKNATMEEVNKQVGLTKTWRTMNDEAVRSTHVAMEGVTVKFDEEFVLPSGAKCMYPKGTGVPEEDINCRCYIEYKVDTDEEGVNKTEKIDDKGYNINININPLSENELIYQDPYQTILKTQNYINWERSVGFDEIENIKAYTGSDYYKDMNSLLRGKSNFDDDPQYKKDLINKIENLKKTLSRFETGDNYTVYRGTYTRHGIEHKQLGDVFILDKGFMSSSFAESITEDFSGIDGDVLYRIRIPKNKKVGAYVDKFSVMKGEEEFLFMPNTKFKLLKIDSKERIYGTQWIYDLEVIE